MFLSIFLVLLLLIGLCFLIDDGQKQSITVESIHTAPVISLQERRKSISDIQKEIDLLLSREPILFMNNSSSLDNNLSESNITLKKIVMLLKSVNQEIMIKISTHSDEKGSRSHNRELSQKRADMIAKYIKQQYKAKFISAIGYGEEFPLPKESNNSSNRRVEILLREVSY